MQKKKHYTGLTDKEVLESRAKNGVNVLTPPEKDPLWKQFLEKFKDPLIIIYGAQNETYNDGKDVKW